MKVRDVKSAIGSLALEGLEPDTKTIQLLYELCDDFNEECSDSCQRKQDT
jgi:hypothetical protein